MFGRSLSVCVLYNSLYIIVETIVLSNANSLDQKSVTEFLRSILIWLWKFPNVELFYMCVR